MRKRLALVTLILLLLASGCVIASATGADKRGVLLDKMPADRHAEPKEVVVFAAASLTEAFSRIGAEFERQHPEAQIVFNFAGSQQLAHQLAQGAPADVFASADQAQMQNAVAAGRVEAGRVKAFAGNLLVIVFPLDNPAALVDWSSLAEPGVKLALAAEAVPVGHYTQTFLKNAARDPQVGEPYRQAVLANVITYDENVRSVLSRVILGEVDAGIVYASDVQAAPAESVGWLPIPKRLNVTAGYFIALTVNSTQSALAAAFIDFVSSARGREILGQHGFAADDSIYAEIAQ